MTSDEVWDLLEEIARVDRRKLGIADRQTWEPLVGDLVFADAADAVAAHYRESREWIMPFDVRRRVAAIRAQRLQDTEVPPPPPELLDNPPAYRAALHAATVAIADGRDPGPAMRAVAQRARREVGAS